MTVERNSFGRQSDSFEEELSIQGVDEPFVGVFIRAPHIVEAGEMWKFLLSIMAELSLLEKGIFSAVPSIQS